MTISSDRDKTEYADGSLPSENSSPRWHAEDKRTKQRPSLHDVVVVFDLDGTLVDTAPDLIGALNEVLLSQGLPEVAPENLRQTAGHGASALLKQGYSQASQSWPDDRATSLVEQFLIHYVARISRESLPFAGIENALQALSRRGATFVVCTNKRTDLAKILLTDLGLIDWFEDVIGGDLPPAPKPDPRHVLHAIEAAGGMTSRAVMVGDSAADIQAARDAGIPSIAVKFGYCSCVSDLAADAIIDTYRDLALTVTNLLRTDQVSS
jgi:phosphoglycolate phosphatase